MTITDSEIQSLKFHLGFGSIGVDAEPYVDFTALFEQIIAPNLTTGPETSSASAITAGVSIITPVSMAGIVPYARLVADVGSDVEAVTVISTSAGTFTARFVRAHPAGCPLALMSGTARLRMLLTQADATWEAMQVQSVGAVSGIQSVDKSDVVFFGGFQVLKDRLRHYRTIQNELGSLVRVTPRTGACSVTSIY